MSHGLSKGGACRAVGTGGGYRLVFVAILVSLTIACGSSAQAQVVAEKPNVVFILADDLDKQLLASHLSDYPNIRALTTRGVTFNNAFVTNALCCPSRSTIFTGLYSHNHHVMHNAAPDGGAPAFRPLEPSALPVWLDNAGYATGYVGKYMNLYDETYVPPGWDEWHGVNTDTGAAKEPGQMTDLFSKQAVSFVRNHTGEEPFYLQVAPIAPHEPAVPYPRHAELFAGHKTPQPPSFNEADVSDKPGYVSKLKPLTRDRIIALNELYRNRLRSMMAVDEMVGHIVTGLEETEELDNTYLIFASDNGVHAGQHRLGEGKRLAYEEDIRVPLIVRGPGIPAGATRSRLVLNNDLAPTFAEWAGATPLLPVDGRSLVPLLEARPPSDLPWRTAFLAEAASHERIGRPAYRAVRTRDYLYVSYADGEKELYNLGRDPYQLSSFYPEASSSLRERLQGRLSSLARCSGSECRTAEGQ
jgi:N-acetylglucosamine-6-sulfatase